ncbi:MAG: HAMP domain-containing sensor histidine kinase [Actinomycetota bacterium]
MQRRLTLAFVGIALAAVVLVGAGVLALAQVGAQASTERSVKDRLEALAELFDEPGSVGNLRSLERLRVSFGLRELDFAFVSADGSVRPFTVEERGDSDRRRVPGSFTIDDKARITLDDDELDSFEAAEPTIVDRRDEDGVLGIQRLEFTARPGQQQISDDALAIIIRQPVQTFAPEARAWFGVSSLAVLIGAAIAGAILARRLSRPIKEIEQATASIASGDFEVRVDDDAGGEVGDLARSVNQMAADLLRSKALDQQFLMSVSHDLRTPLTVIAGYAEALQDGAARNTGETGRIIKHHADRLERLVGDLLDLAKLDANRFTLHPEQIDLGVHVARAVAGHQPEAQRHSLRVNTDTAPDVIVDADPHRLAQVVGNVMSNAITFARAEIAVRVDATSTEAIVEISDDGPGIAPDDLPHVFERLYVASSQPDRAENSSGLGLAIVRELMTAMGGSVSARSELGVGTTMVLRLPRRPPKAAPPQPMGSETASTAASDPAMASGPGAGALRLR